MSKAGTAVKGIYNASLVTYATGALFKFNKTSMMDELRKEFKDMNHKVLPDLFAAEIRASKWEWFGVTLRKNGRRVSSPRDIVDTGALLTSHRIVDVSPNIIDHIWDRENSKLIHDGSPKYRARPWTKGVMDRLSREGIIK